MGMSSGWTEMLARVRAWRGREDAEANRKARKSTYERSSFEAWERRTARTKRRMAQAGANDGVGPAGARRSEGLADRGDSPAERYDALSARLAEITDAYYGDPNAITRAPTYPPGEVSGEGGASAAELVGAARSGSPVLVPAPPPADGAVAARCVDVFWGREIAPGAEGSLVLCAEVCSWSDAAARWVVRACEVALFPPSLLSFHRGLPS